MKPKALLAALAVVVVSFGVFAFALERKGRAAMTASDEAFHRGDLRTATRRARDAGLLFVPGTPHVAASERRLLSIARGAEAEGNFTLAFEAWDALRLVSSETRYFGRAEPEYSRQAEAGLERLRKREELGNAGR